MASDGNSTVCGGRSNLANGDYASVSGGENNMALHESSTVSGGIGLTTTTDGEHLP